jgi:tetratricopeptide (TPR) repeat protein
MAADVVVPFILYVTLIRLAIITAGAISIVLGYRLFCKGVWPESGSGQGSTVDAAFAGQRFTVKNAAPGTCFALFGVIIISVMFATSPPEFSQTGSGETTLRGAPKAEPPASEVSTNQLHAQLRKAKRAYQQRDFSGADALYEKIHADLTTSIEHAALLHNELALRYLEEAKYDKALQHSQVAVMLVPKDSDSIDTRVLVTCQAQGPAAALRELTTLAGANSAVHAQRRRALEHGHCRSD